MFSLSIDDRLSAWAQHRAYLETSNDPLLEADLFWQAAPFVPYNHKVDPYYQRGWPSPWEIIVDNKYDDFTKALMKAWSLKLTKRFENSKIEIRIYVDKLKTSVYNCVCVDEEWLINYSENEPISLKNLPESFLLENVIEVSTSR